MKINHGFTMVLESLVLILRKRKLWSALSLNTQIYPMHVQIKELFHACLICHIIAHTPCFSITIVCDVLLNFAHFHHETGNCSSFTGETLSFSSPRHLIPESEGKVPSFRDGKQWCWPINNNTCEQHYTDNQEFLNIPYFNLSCYMSLNMSST